MRRTLKASAGWLIFWVGFLTSCLGPAASEGASVHLPLVSRAMDSRSFRQTIWTTEQGLPDNTIKALLQTRDGYLWIGTAGGLVRYDGLRFTVFQRRTHPEMVNDDCRVLAQATDGSLWIGTANGLLRYTGGAFQRYTTDEGLGDSQVRLLQATRQNEIWITGVRGLSCWRKGMLRRYLMDDPTAPKSYTDFTPLVLAEDREGILWLSDGLGLRHWDRQTDRFRSNALSHVFKGMGVAALIGDEADKYWAFSGGVDSTYVLHRYDAGHMANFSPPGPVNLAGDAQFLVRDRQGNLWSSAGRFGLDCFRDGQFTRFTGTNGLSDTWVHAFCEDREGNLWIGTERGLNRWQPRRIRAYSTQDGLVHDSAWTLCETRDGSLWIGTDGGLSRFSGGYFTNYTEHDGLVKNTVRALAEDADGALWIGSGGGGIDVFRDGKFTNLRLPGDSSGNKIRALHRGRGGVMWVGTESGLHRFQNGQWTTWTTTNGLPHPDVRAVYETRDGALWVGTFGGGAWQAPIPENTPQPTSPIQALNTTNGLASNFAWAFHEDAAGALWIGTEGGLSRWKDHRIFSFTTEQGLSENIINEILEDGSGNLWLSGEEGIYRIPRRELEAVAEGRVRKVNVAAFGVADGLLSRETNGQKSQPAGWRTRDGTLWFPTTRGIVAIEPRAGILNEVPPPVVIEQVRADETIVFGSARFSTNTGFDPGSSALRLPPGRARVLEFHYTANSLVAPELARFRYRLEGHDRNWTDAGDRRIAYYTGLPPGAYRFHVLACNNHGIWNDTGASYAFSLAPHFYETMWFYAVAGLGVIGGAYGLHRLRLGVANHLQSLEHQLALERERARIARDIHDEVGANLTQIGLWTELARRNIEAPHPAAQPIQRVETAARDAFESLGEIVWAINPQNDTLRSLLAYLRTYVQEFLEAAQIKVQLDWPDEIPDFGVNAQQRHQLFLVVQEALRNVVRHAAATEVGVSVRIDSSNLSLWLRDNGRGFDGEMPRTGGNGLTNMARRVSEMGGKFRLASQAGRGTKITIEVPLRFTAEKPSGTGVAGAH